MTCTMNIATLKMDFVKNSATLKMSIAKNCDTFKNTEIYKKFNNKRNKGSSISSP